MDFNRLVNKVLEEQFAGEFGMQDRSITPAQGLEVAKFFDPTGVLSWGDVKQAYNTFLKNPTKGNAVLLALGIFSVIPGAGKVAKTALSVPNAPLIARQLRQVATNIDKIDPVQLTKQGIKQEVIEKAGQMIQQDTEQTIRGLAAQSSQITRRIAKIPSQNFIERYNLGRYTYDDAVNQMDQVAREVANITRNLKFDPRQIKIVQFQRNWHGRDFVKIDIPGDRIVMYRSYKGTEGKEPGLWYLTGGLADLIDPSTGQVSQRVLKTQESVNLSHGASRYITDLARYLKDNYNNLF